MEHHADLDIYPQSRYCASTHSFVILLRIDKGSPGGALHSGTSNHNCCYCYDILYIFGKAIFFSIQWCIYDSNWPTIL